MSGIPCSFVLLLLLLTSHVGLLHSFQSTLGLRVLSREKIKSTHHFMKARQLNDPTARQPHQGRRKMGPPQRKKPPPQVQNEPAFGRISVYCVGAAIDIPALRAYIFRKNFGSNDQNGLSIPRSSRDMPDVVDEEVLHVSNAPMFITANDTYKKIPASAIDPASQTIIVPDTNAAPGSVDLVNVEDEEEMWRARETMLMATQDVFYFDYGCVVFWGLTPREEKAAMTELAAFTTDPVNPAELDSSYDHMEFSFDRKVNPQRPIRFDRMRLRSLQIEEKLSLSYAMAQSSKLFVFESKVLERVEQTRYLPNELASMGKIKSSKRDLNMLIGQLFVLQTEVNLFSSILDTPDFLWDDDEHLPAYQFTRNYLEVDDRVQLLNSRLAVIRDLLDVLQAQISDSNSTRLEWIVIWLISVEIVMGIMSNPMFAGRRVATSLLVPTCIWAYKKIDSGGR